MTVTISCIAALMLFTPGAFALWRAYDEKAYIAFAKSMGPPIQSALIGGAVLRFLLAVWLIFAR